MYPIADPPPGSLFVHDTRTAAALLAISPRQVMQLAKSGELLFRYIPGAHKRLCPQADIDTYRRKQERRNPPEQTRP